MKPKIIHLDELINICGQFNSNSPVNNGYGCNHQECGDGEFMLIQQDSNSQFYFYNYCENIETKIYQRHGIFSKKQLVEIKKDKIFRRFFEKLKKDPYNEIFLKEVGVKWFGKCYSFSCPLATECDLEDLKKHDSEYYDEWKNEEYEPNEAGGNLMLIHDDGVLGCC